MIRDFGPDGMSEDGSNHDNGTGRPSYDILDHSWRNPYAASCLRTVDALHRDNKFRPIRRVGPGAHPHNRIHSMLKSTKPPVTNLRASYYDSQWLARQSTIVKNELQVREERPGEEYNFSHDPFIVAYVLIPVILIAHCLMLTAGAVWPRQTTVNSTPCGVMRDVRLCRTVFSVLVDRVNRYDFYRAFKLRVRYNVGA